MEPHSVDTEHFNATEKGGVTLKTSNAPVPYVVAMEEMEPLVHGVKTNTHQEIIWFLEHTPVYTYGVRTDSAHVDQARKGGIPVCLSQRGGQLTFHGPGQRIVYCVIHLRRRTMGVGAYVACLEQWIIDALAYWGIQGFKVDGQVGVWTQRGKIASIGVRVSGGVASHGLALNVEKGGAGFASIVPCGLDHVTMTSVQDVAPHLTMAHMDRALLVTLPF
jgi:lipoyl(octanoyl) transferase